MISDVTIAGIFNQIFYSILVYENLKSRTEAHLSYRNTIING